MITRTIVSISAEPARHLVYCGGDRLSATFEGGFTDADDSSIGRDLDDHPIARIGCDLDGFNAINFHCGWLLDPAGHIPYDTKSNTLVN